jgi:hypothetical protein
VCQSWLVVTRDTSSPLLNWSTAQAGVSVLVPSHLAVHLKGSHTSEFWPRNMGGGVWTAPVAFTNTLLVPHTFPLACCWLHSSTLAQNVEDCLCLCVDGWGNSPGPQPGPRWAAHRWEIYFPCVHPLQFGFQPP